MVADSDKIPHTYSRENRTVTEEFQKFILAPDYPCLAARGIAKREDFVVREYGHMNFRRSLRRLADDLSVYTAAWESHDQSYRTFAAVFASERPTTEEEFEQKLWVVLRTLSEVDPEPWDPAVSSDPESPEFAFSYAGEAYYIIGLHPHASRPARRFRYPTLVFNRHRFFSDLRTEDAYEKMRDLVRTRDRRANGSVNPMLSDFGTSSEAIQYGGRLSDETWECPFADSFRRRQQNDNESGEQP